MTETPARPAVLWLSSILLALLFVGFQIQSSLHSGALSLPSTYDDLNYFNDALPRLGILYRDGGRAFLLGLLANPPHAPLQTFLALAGFGLFGPHPWAAYVMNMLPLTLLLRLLLGLAARALPLGTSVVLAAALLGFPLLGLMVLDFRPDMLCAMLTAAGALIVIADPRWRAGDRRSLQLACALFVGALLAKPTLAPVTVVVFGVAAVAVVALQSRSRAEARRLALLAMRCGGLGALIALPYYLAALPHLIEYIHVNVFGSQANIWRHQYSALDNALYYITGPGGHVAVGRAWLTLAGVLVLLALPILNRHRAVAAGVMLVALTAYASVTAPAMKSPYLGLVVPALILGLVTILSIALLLALPRRARLPLALVLLAFSAVAWRPVSLRLWNEPAPVSRIQNYGRILAETVDVIAAVPDLGRRHLYFPLIAQYLNQDNVAFELRRRGLPVPATPELYFNRNLADHEAAIRNADLVVLFSDDCTLPIPWPASVAIRKEIGAAVVASGAFEPIAKVDGGPYGGNVVILKRKGG
jgi:4-amino-4-deoxy-L-arabinose transferase-like glycosyltransferase